MLVKETAQEMMNSQQNGNSMENVVNEFQVQLLDCSKLFAYYYTIRLFNNYVSNVKNNNSISQGIKSLLRRVLFVFSLSAINDHIKHFFEFGCVDKSQAKMVQKLLFRVCQELRYDVVGLTDCFNVPDMCLKAPLGRYDGDIYNKYFDMVKNGRWGTGEPKYWGRVFGGMINSRL